MEPWIGQHSAEAAGDSPLQKKLHAVVYGTDTRAGRLFDLVLVVAILFSVLIIMLDTVSEATNLFGGAFHVVEWIVTALFTVEYALRLYCVGNPWRYARSFFGVVDLLSILPAYLSLFFPGSEYLLIIRVLRLLRIFRILKMLRYVQSGGLLMRSLYDSRHKIIVFYMFVLVMVVIFGAVVYVVEGPENGFTSIPKSIYWAIVTVTTTGYGDITPKTVLGEMIASFVMITGYAIIAVPTGIFTAELAANMRRQVDERQCPHCGELGHEVKARFCHHCGSRLGD